ncbi:MAG: SSS family solute:Na+ symporter [Pseudohongiellaceae bacterium]
MQETSFNWVLICILLYVAMQLVISFIVMRRLKNETDYLLAGRKLGVPFGAMSVFATWFGAETCIGAAGAIYEHGLAGARIDPFGYAACMFIMGFFFARKLWSLNLTTLGDFFARRYGKAVEKLGVTLMIPASVIWASAQILAFGHVLSATSTIALELSIAFAAVMVIAYTALGGFLADVISDFIQGIVLIIGLLVLLVVVCTNLPAADVISAGFSIERMQLREDSETWFAVINDLSIPIIGSLFTAELITRVLASRSAESARKSVLLGASLYVLVGLIPVFFGMIGPQLIPGLVDGEQLLPLLAEAYLPTALFVVFAGALMSAILSTVDSALLAAGSLASHNIILPLLGTKSDKAKVRISRLSVAIFGLIAYGLAANADSVLGLVVEASAFGSAGIFTCCLLGLSQKRGGKLTAATSMVVGMFSYGTLYYGFESDYAYLYSLALALVSYLALMPFEAGPEMVEETQLG